MNNRIIKILLALAVLVVMAVPAQTFAAGYGYTVKTNGYNYSKSYNQYVKKYNGYNVKSQPQQNAKQTVQTKQAPASTASNTAAPAAKPTAAAPASTATGAYEQQVVDLVNKERAAAGLPALKLNTKLSGVAEKKAEDLRDKNYFAHQSPTYGSPFDMMKQFGISYKSAGENIAKGQKTPAAVMTGWMNSAGHKANILSSNFTEIGVGYVTDSKGGTYWVQMFIRP